MVLLGKKIKNLRNKYKFTQTELANKVGVTKSTIAAYENDSRVPSYPVLIKMCYVFNVTVDSLLMEQAKEVIDISGLSSEQIGVLKYLITQFRRSNT